MDRVPRVHGRRRPRAVLLDAFGTLLELEPPAPELRRRLAAAGHEYPNEVVARALAAEISHYRANHLRGSDPTALRALREECAGVLAAALGGTVPPLGALVEMLLASLRFQPFPDAPRALAALSAAGLRLAVVSDWDCSLSATLAQSGLDAYVDVVVTSAEVGTCKPDPAVFRAALDALGVPADAAVHCGDTIERDVVGACAAGVRPILVDRARRHLGEGAERVSGLAELVALLTAPRSG